MLFRSRTFTSAKLQVSISGSMGDFQANALAQKTWGSGDDHTLWGNPIPMATMAGSYGGRVRSAGLSLPQQTLGVFTIDAGGNFATTVLGCSFAGTLVPHGSTGVFEVAATAIGAACGFRGALTGIVTPMSFVSGVPVLGLQLDTADNTQTAVFILTKQ